MKKIQLLFNIFVIIWINNKHFLLFKLYFWDLVVCMVASFDCCTWVLSASILCILFCIFNLAVNHCFHCNHMSTSRDERVALVSGSKMIIFFPDHNTSNYQLINDDSTPMSCRSCFVECQCQWPWCCQSPKWRMRVHIGNGQCTYVCNVAAFQTWIWGCIIR